MILGSACVLSQYLGSGEVHFKKNIHLCTGKTHVATVLHDKAKYIYIYTYIYRHITFPYISYAFRPCADCLWWWLVSHGFCDLFKPLHHPRLTAIDLLQRWAQRRVHRRNVLRAADEVHLRRRDRLRQGWDLELITSISEWGFYMLKIHVYIYIIIHYTSIYLLYIVKAIFCVNRYSPKQFPGQPIVTASHSPIYIWWGP